MALGGKGLLGKVLNAVGVKPSASSNSGDSEDNSTESADKFSAADQSPDERELCGYIKNKVEEVRASGARISAEGIWMTNIAYLLGYDSIYYDTNQRMFRPVNQGARFLRRNRVHINKVLPTAQNRLARLCKNPPKFDVRPESSSEEDKDRARFELEVLAQLWDQEGIQLNKQRIPLYMWLQQCGHSYIKVSWDECLGKALIDPESGDFDGYEGDIRADICSAFELFVDPLAKTIDEATWAVQAKVRKLEYFRSHYPDRGEAVTEEGPWLLSVQYEQRINSLNTSGPMSSGTNIQMKNAAIELSYYEKRSKKYPNGRHCVTANEILLKDDELLIGEIPFTKFDDVLIAGKFYSEAIITHLRPLQDQFNRLYSSRAVWTNRLLHGKYLAAKGHGIIQEGLNDADTEVVQYTVVPNAPPPAPMAIPVIPQYAYVEETNLEKQFDEISGISEVSKGQLPSASIPAVGMQLLQEQDETRIGIQTEWAEDAWARVGRQLLKTAQKQYVTPRYLKKAGKLGEYNVKEYVGANITANPDVTVIRGSTIPNSKILRRQELLNVFTQGLLGDPHDPKVLQQVLEQLEYGEIGEVWEEQSLVANQIKKSITMIENGVAPSVNEFDNHIMHLKKKNLYRISDKFDLLPPHNQGLLMADMEAHLHYITQQNGSAQPPPNPMDHVMANNPPPPPNGMAPAPNVNGGAPVILGAPPIAVPQGG